MQRAGAFPMESLRISCVSQDGPLEKEERACRRCACPAAWLLPRALHGRDDSWGESALCGKRYRARFGKRRAIGALLSHA